jgi:predicted PurR-regulated permease PerM
MSSRQSSRLVRTVHRLPHGKQFVAEPVREPASRNPATSPTWSNTAKLAVSLSLVAASAWLLMRFRNVVGVLLLAILLAYLLYPVADLLRTRLNFSWRLASTLVFVFSLLIVFGLLFLGGFTIVTQAQSLIVFIQNALKDGLPDLLTLLPTFDFGNFHFPPASISDLGSVSQELLGLVNPVLSQTTSLLTSVASGAATFIGWTFFTLLIAYFILAESSGIPGQMIRFNVPEYSLDIQKFGRYFSGIWNAFLRGQLIIITITIFVYVVVLSTLGVRFALGLALLAGLARFVPYVGPAVAWTTYGLVAFFQDGNLFNLPPLWFVVVVVGAAWLTDIILDNFVAARLMGNALQIHPALVMVSAIIAANLLGLVGVVLAAPVVATLKLVSEYVLNKLLDRDPWEGVRTNPPPIARPLAHFVRYNLAKIISLWGAFQKRRNIG